MQRNGKQVLLSTGTDNLSRAQAILERLSAMDEPGPIVTPGIEWRGELLNEFHGCTRTRMATALAGRAFEILSGEPERFAFLLEPKPQKTILAELGRIPWREFMFQVADHVCQHKLERVAAIRAISFARDKRRRPDPTLGDMLWRTIRTWTRRYPNSRVDVRSMLEAMILDLQYKTDLQQAA